MVTKSTTGLKVPMTIRLLGKTSPGAPGFGSLAAQIESTMQRRCRGVSPPMRASLRLIASRNSPL
jgi:hypothetical protein